MKTLFAILTISPSERDGDAEHLACLQYIPRNMHTVLLCCVWIWINTSCEFIMNDCITTTKQSTTKPCAYFLGCTVCCMHGQANDQIQHCSIYYSLRFNSRLSKTGTTKTYSRGTHHEYLGTRFPPLIWPFVIQLKSTHIYLIAKGTDKKALYLVFKAMAKTNYQWYMIEYYDW